MRRRLQAILIILALVVSMLPMNAFAASNASSGYGIPKEIKDCWRYVGGDNTSSEGGVTWVRGNAYQKHDHTFMNGKIDTNTKAYKDANAALQKDEYLKSAKICILYLEGCPYSKSWLPSYQIMARESGVKVLLVDVNKYKTGSLLPYYDCISSAGTASPIVLYIDKEGVLQGKGGVHSQKDFADILKACGYENVPYSEDDLGYDKDQEKKDEILKEVNRQRLKENRLPLSTYQGFQDKADFRAEEIVRKISHERPDGSLFVTALDGLTAPDWWGENICAGPIVSTPWSAMIGWMNSPGHRANILSEKYSHIGVGYYKNEKPASGQYEDHWVQLFSGKCDVTEVTLDQPQINVGKGTPITDMGIKVMLKCSTHGTTTMPLIDEMCTGYDKDKAGEQRVTVKYGNKTTALIVTVGSVEKVKLTDDMIKLSTTEMQYNGMPLTPDVSVTNPTGDYPLMEGYSYSVEYRHNVEVGTASVIITGKGNYTGKITKTFNINKKSISNAEFKGLEKTYEYTGKPVTPSFNIVCDGVTLHEGRDYTVSYIDNTGKMKEPKRGASTYVDEDVKAKITVEGIGNYTGNVDATFGFKMNKIHRQAQDLVHALNPSHSTDSTYNMLKEYQRTETNPKLFEGKLKDIGDTINKRKEDGTLDNIRSCSLTPEANDRINDYYRFVCDYEGKVNVENVVEKPSVDSNIINNANVAGLEAIIDENTASVQLAISDYKPEKPLDIDSAQYDSSNIVPLDIKLNINNQEVAKPTQAVTITVDVPKTLSADDDLVVLHYKDGAEKPEVLETRINEKNNTLTFVTSSFSPFVITKRLETYQAAVKENNVANGIDYGEEFPDAPSNVRITSVTSTANGGTATVEWDKVTDSKWNVKGYLIKYADNDRMENAKTMEVGSDTTTTTIPNILSDWCYVTVSTKATLAALGDYAVNESLGESNVTGKAMPKDTVNEYAVNVETAKNGTVTASPSKAHMGDKVTITAKANAGYELSKITAKTDSADVNVNKTSQENEYSITMPRANVTVSAEFTEVPTDKTEDVQDPVKPDDPTTNPVTPDNPVSPTPVGPINPTPVGPTPDKPETPDKNTPTVTVETDEDGNKTETTEYPVQEDGTKVVEIKVTDKDDKLIEKKTTETKTIENKAGNTVEVVTATTENAAGEKTVEKTSTIQLNDKEKAVVKVTTEADGDTEATAEVKKTGTKLKSGATKGIITGSAVDQIKEAAGKAAEDLTIKVVIKDAKGKKFFSVTADAEDIEAGKTLYILKNGKNDKQTLVNAVKYKVTKNGGVTVSLKVKGDFELVTKAEKDSLVKEIKKTIAPTKKVKTVKKGKKTNMTLKKTLDRANVKSIKYKTTNKKVATVNKAGKVTAKKKGTATIKATVTLKDGSYKIVKTKVRVK